MSAAGHLCREMAAKRQEVPFMRGDPAAHPNRLPYRVMLRVIGRSVDECSGLGVNLIETRDGFAIRYYRGVDPRAIERKYLSFAEIHSMDTEQRKDRRPRLRIPKKVSRVAFSDSYSDYLRALGGEVDQRQGGGMALEELRDGVFISYLYQDPLTALHFRVTSITLSMSDCQAALSNARGGRNASPPRWAPRDS